MQNREKLLILVLTAFTFILGTTEYVIVGLLKNVANSFGISVAITGTIVSVFAIAFAVGTPIAMMVANYFSKTTTILTGSLLIVLLNMSVAIAPSYEVLVMIRILTAVVCGLCVTLSLSISVEAVSKHKRGIAIAYIMGGFTIANVFGVPIGTLIAQYFHWKTTFVLIGFVGLLCTFALYKTVPKGLPKVQSSIKAQAKLLMTPQILIAFFIPIMGVSAIFGLYTYIVPFMTDIIGVPTNWVSVLLVVYGISTIISNIIGGKIASGNYAYKLRNIFLVHAAIFLVLGFTAHITFLGVMSLLAIGAISFSINAAIQIYLIQLTEELLPSARDFASSLMPIGANIGIALGSAVNAFVIDQFGLTYIPWTAVAFALLAFGTTAFSIVFNRARAKIV